MRVIFKRTIFPALCVLLPLLGCKTEQPDMTKLMRERPMLVVHPADPRRVTRLEFPRVAADLSGREGHGRALFSAASARFIFWPNTREGELPWMMFDDGWLYITGNQPRVGLNTVAAAAEGSALYGYTVNDPTNPRVRWVLLDTHGKKPGDVEKSGATPASRDFAKKTPSYIDAHLTGGGTIDPPVSFTMPDLTKAQPAGFDNELWQKLNDLNTALTAAGMSLPPGNVGP